MASAQQSANLLKRPDRRARNLLMLAFGSCAMFLVIAQGLAYWRSSQISANIWVIEGNALESIRLVSVMGIAVERERNLLAGHIFAQSATQRHDIEAEIERVEQQFANAASRYAHLATFYGEAGAWQRFTADIQRTKLPIAHALELSRADRDAEAAEALKQVLPAYAAVSTDVDELLAINRSEATAAKQNTAHLQSADVTTRLTLAFCLLCVMFIAGVWTTRVIVRLHRQLFEQQQELEDRNRELDAFAGRVAHDLRGPLNTLSLSASMLAEQAPSERSTATIMRKGIAQMASLIDELLALSRAGVIPNGIARVETVAESLEHDLAPIVQQAGGVLKLDLEPAVVGCSEGLFRQLLWNLCDNALKYRRPTVAPAIAIVGRRDSSGYAIRVADNGIGLAHDEAQRVFEPFYRSERAQRLPGTGLGLAIVRRVVQAVGGVIAVDSVLDQGTTFTIELPLSDSSSLASQRSPTKAAG